MRALRAVKRRRPSGMDLPALASEGGPFGCGLILPEQVRRDNLALNCLFLITLLFVDGGEGVPGDFDDRVDADDLGEEFDGGVERAFGIGGVGLTDQALDLGRRFYICRRSPAALRVGSIQQSVAS